MTNNEVLVIDPGSTIIPDSNYQYLKIIFYKRHDIMNRIIIWRSENDIIITKKVIKILYDD